jgi:CBS domain-containing protein
MAQHDVNQVPVVWGREIVGMLERGDVMRFIQVRRDLDERVANANDGAPRSGDAMPTHATPAEHQ